MHAAEREKAIMDLLANSGFVSFREIGQRIEASPMTLRRDLDRLAGQGLLSRVHGGAVLTQQVATSGIAAPSLSGVPFHENIARHSTEKEAIGRTAASLCSPGEAVMIDGGSTTLQMCPHIDGLNLQVMTNSLHIVGALLPQVGTRISVPGGAVFREQNIILSAADDELMPRFYAPKLFMGAAALGPRGIMQADVLLVAAERRLIDRADALILLVDSSKFLNNSGNVVCPLDEVDIIITDDGIADEHRAMLEAADIQLMVAPVDRSTKQRPRPVKGHPREQA